MGRRRSFRPLLAALVLLASSGAAQTPLINEFMGSNASTIADDDGDYSDWLELHNPVQAPFDLTGCYLSDDAGNPLRWRFPASSVPPQGFLLVWASGKDRQSAGGDLHTNFAISAGGEPLLLTAADGQTLLDQSPATALAADVSYGRLPDGAPNWAYFGVSTPGTANISGLQFLAPPVFSHPPGFHAGALSLALTAADPEAAITYTLDGSEPTLQSPVYESPLLLDSRAGEPNVLSLIPTNRVLSGFTAWRPPRGEVLKINVVRARAFRRGFAPSAVTTGSFLIGGDLPAQLPLPVVSLATARANFFANDIGIYVPGATYIPGDVWSGNYYQEGDAWERPVHIELFDAQGARLLAQDAGARIHGGYSRHFPQKSLRLYARAEYGASQFEAAVFPALPYTAYKRLLLRNSGNDWGRTGFKDLAIQTMVAGMGFDTQAGRPVIHFIDGEYWGLANLRERYDRHYIVRRWGVAEDEVVMLENNAEVDEGLPDDNATYLALRSYVAGGDMTQPQAMTFVAERMDVDNFIAYVTAEI